MSILSVNLALTLGGIANLVLRGKNVAIYQDTKEVLTGNAAFDTAILSCVVTEDSNLMEHPVESGFKITDNKVFNPVEIDIRLCMPTYYYDGIYKELRYLYEQSPKLKIKTQSKYYTNMVLQGMPHEEKPENFDRIVFDLHFKQVPVVYPQYIKLPANQLKNAENSDTQKLGTNVTNSQKRSSILADGIKDLGSLLGG